MSFPIDSTQDYGNWRSAVYVDGIRYIFTNSPINTEVLAITYMVSGFLALTCNLFNIYIFTSLQKGNSKYQIFIALELAELINGLAYLGAGVTRFIMLHTGSIFAAISTAGCFFARPYTALLIVGTQLPAIIVCISSVERLMAVYQPSLYLRLWDSPFRIRLLLGALLLQTVSIALAGLSAWLDPYMNSTQHCPVGAAVSTLYASVHFLFQILAYFTSFVTLTCVYLKRKKMISSKRGASHFRATMLLTGFCLVVMSCPSVVSLGKLWNMLHTGDAVFAAGITIPSLISLSTTISNGIFHKEYRRKVHSAIGYRFGCHLSKRDDSSVQYKNGLAVAVTPVNRKSTNPSTQT